jgi:hypothetical protein
VPVHCPSATTVLAPFCVIWHVVLWVCTPPPHDAVHELQPLCTHATGQAASVHVFCVAGCVVVQNELATTVPGDGAAEDWTHDTIAVEMPDPQSTEHAVQVPTDHT